MAGRLRVISVAGSLKDKSLSAPFNSNDRPRTKLAADPQRLLHGGSRIGKKTEII
jgi:hypothetical protein